MRSPQKPMPFLESELQIYPIIRLISKASEQKKMFCEAKCFMVENTALWKKASKTPEKQSIKRKAPFKFISLNQGAELLEIWIKFQFRLLLTRKHIFSKATKIKK